MNCNSVLARRYRIVCSLFLFLLTGFEAQAAEVSIPNLLATPGQWIATTVKFSKEAAQISALQFDLEWDAGLAVQIAAGRDLANAGKVLYAAGSGTRTIRILIAGTDRALLGDGEIVRLFLAAGPDFGSPQIRLSNVLAATPEGDASPVRAVSATMRIGPGDPGTAILPESVLNAASLLPGPIAPGEIVTLLGAFAIPKNSSAGVAVTVNGSAMPVLYASGNQINAVVPLSIDIAKAANLNIRIQDRQVAQLLVPVAAASPALFTQSGAGIGLGSILNQDYSSNSFSNPAPAGSVVMLYGTGFGPLVPPAIDGQPGVLSAIALPVSAKIAQFPAEVLYAGAAPGLPGGLIQINVRIPGELAPGQPALISLNVGDFAIASGVTIAVR
jgi:uncharacterized protein (TIGR03437 family)